MELASRVEELS